MIVVLDASSFISAALKQNSVSGKALLAAIASPNQIITSADVEDEYREVLFPTMNPWRGILILTPAEFLALHYS